MLLRFFAHINQSKKNATGCNKVKIINLLTVAILESWILRNLQLSFDWMPFLVD